MPGLLEPVVRWAVMNCEIKQLQRKVKQLQDRLSVAKAGMRGCSCSALVVPQLVHSLKLCQSSNSVHFLHSYVRHPSFTGLEQGMAALFLCCLPWC